MKKSVKRMESRKNDHFKLALSDKAQVGNPGFDNYRFTHNALPGIDFGKIDTSTTFLGKKVNYPFFISPMTGGIEKGNVINHNLAKAAQKHKIALGVGSQRIALQVTNRKSNFKIRQYAPDIPLLANIGLVQFNYGLGVAEFQRCVDMIEADALFVHLNPIQEVFQPEGDRNWENLLPKLEKVVKKLSVPVVVKEVGFGLSEEVVAKLYNIGIRYFDTAGWGGTNWAIIEAQRRRGWQEIGKTFSHWGIPTVESIKMCEQFKNKFKSQKKKEEMVILGSGGIRTGLDVAKALCLGADLAGIAQSFAQAAVKSQKQVEKLIEKLGLELKIAMFGVGANNISQLKKIKPTSI